MTPLVELAVDGRRYGGWTAVRVTRGLERMAADFELTVTEAWPGRSEPWAIRPGSACRLLVDGEPLIEGWTDDYAPSFSAGDHRVGIGGRSRTGDLVDCSVIQPGGQFKDYDLAQIARALCAPFGVPVRIDEGVDIGAPFPDVQVQQGETVFELLDRLASLRGVLLTDGPDGALVVTVAGRRRASGALVQGVNVLEASATLAHRERYSRYVVKGQRAGSDEVFGRDAAQVSGEAADPAVTRYRPLLLMAEGQVDPATARIRARWEALARAARSIEAHVTVQGWRQPDGRLWQPGELVPVRSAWLGLDRDLLVTEATWLLDGSGTRSELSLVPAEALTPEPGGGAARGAKDDQWVNAGMIK
jgi:prophage tail gpP-like protein